MIRQRTAPHPADLAARRPTTARMSWSPTLSSAPKVVRRVALAALIAAAGLSLPVVHDEWVSAHLEAAATEDLGGPSPLPWDAGGDSHLCVADCPPRGDAAMGVHLALTAAAEPDPVIRHVQLAEAQRRLQAALSGRPAEAGWWAWLAYARSLDGRDEREVLDALTRSYAAAPFLAQEGPWRAGRCASDWPLLSPRLRAQVINEVVWMRDVDPVNAATAMGAFTAPSAQAALKLGLARPAPLLVPHRRSGGPGGVGAPS